MEEERCGLPNAETRKAMEDARYGRVFCSKTIDDLRVDLESGEEEDSGASHEVAGV